MSETVQRRIGEIAFTISRDGVIKRTAVSGLRENGFEVLEPGHTTVFSWEEAIHIADKSITARLVDDSISRKDERVLRARLEALSGTALRDQVFAESYVKVSGIHASFLDTELDANTIFPTEYFLPGQTVYGLVTHKTRNTMSPCWRPRPFFILEVTVKEVSYAPGWAKSLSYRFAHTHYYIPAHHLFADEAAAREAMIQVFADETLGSIRPEAIPIFSEEEDKKAQNELFQAVSSKPGTDFTRFSNGD